MPSLPYRLSKLPIVIGGLGGGGGYGFAVNNETGEQTFMKVTMGEWGLGLGTRGLRQCLCV